MLGVVTFLVVASVGYPASGTATAAPPGPAAPASTSPMPEIGEEPPGATGAPPLRDPRTEPDLDRVAVTSPALDQAVERYRADRLARDRAAQDQARAESTLDELDQARRRLVGASNQATRRRSKSERALDRLRPSLDDLAVADYVAGARSAPVDLDWNDKEVTRARGARVVLDVVRRRQLADTRLHASVVSQTTQALTELADELAEVARRQDVATRERDTAVSEQARLGNRLVEDTRAMADLRRLADVRGTDLPLVALDAYYRAARQLASEQPACGLRWWLLAGIGRTESGHGSFGASHLDVAGTADPPIVGVPLDGTGGNARIEDTDGGRWDGDATLDRAVGPLQFIPSTWARWARDGNGDGRLDPQNLYDAALAAAGYLCLYGPGLDTDDGMRNAVIRYNADPVYVETVISRARRYEQAVSIGAT